jgi:hypothetical protein
MEFRFSKGNPIKWSDKSFWLIIPDFNHKSSEHIESLVSLFVLVKFSYPPSPKNLTEEILFSKLRHSLQKSLEGLCYSITIYVIRLSSGLEGSLGAVPTKP